MTKINRKADESNTYIGFISNISFIIRGSFSIILSISSIAKMMKNFKKKFVLRSSSWIKNEIYN